jgi:phosphatidylserine/phosphatidylglycerophosphate/cardiolipin synthase-like enzyme
MNELVLNEEIYHRVIQTEVPAAKNFLWIATADIKDLHVERGRKRFVPFLEVLAELVREGVEVRLIHAKEPGPRFREDFDKFPELVESQRFERLLCPRMHMKVVIIDGKTAFVGSANLTGAGMGSKSPLRRNFEAGFISTDPTVIERSMDFLDQLWIGDHCIKCGRRKYCPDPVV